jgi:hypothetical protein
MLYFRNEDKEICLSDNGDGQWAGAECPFRDFSKYDYCRRSFPALIKDRIAVIGTIAASIWIDAGLIIQRILSFHRMMPDQSNPHVSGKYKTTDNFILETVPKCEGTYYIYETGTVAASFRKERCRNLFWIFIILLRSGHSVLDSLVKLYILLNIDNL